MANFWKQCSAVSKVKGIAVTNYDGTYSEEMKGIFYKFYGFEKEFRIEFDDKIFEKGLKVVIDYSMTETTIKPVWAEVCGTRVAPPGRSLNPQFVIREDTEGQAPANVQPANKGAQPAQKVAQPTNKVTQPTQNVAQPTNKVAQPTQNTAQTANKGAQPVQNPVQNANKGVQPNNKPVQNQPIKAKQQLII